MRRLTILAKGNADVRDSLYALTENGSVGWNGINTVLRERRPGCRARLIHETMARSDVLLDADGTIPAPLAKRPLPLAAYSPAGQFTTRMFDGQADAIILSIQSDVMNRTVRHRTDGHLFYPHDLDVWPDADRRWLIDHYAPAPPLDASEAMAHLARIVDRVRTQGDPAILVYNMSPIVPWERLHCYRGVVETLAERIRSFNHALIDLSRASGISIVDVDAIVARGGAETLKIDAVTLTAAGCRQVAEEVVRILDDLGLLAADGGVS